MIKWGVKTIACIATLVPGLEPVLIRWGLLAENGLFLMTEDGRGLVP